MGDVAIAIVIKCFDNITTGITNTTEGADLVVVEIVGVAILGVANGQSAAGIVVYYLTRLKIKCKYLHLKTYSYNWSAIKG